MPCYPGEDYDVPVVPFAEEGERGFDVVYL